MIKNYLFGALFGFIWCMIGSMYFVYLFYIEYKEHPRNLKLLFVAILFAIIFFGYAIFFLWIYFKHG